MVKISVIILLVLHAMALGGSLYKHGEPKDENYNFFTTLIACAVMIALYYYAGLFDVFTK